MRIRIALVLALIVVATVPASRPAPPMPRSEPAPPTPAPWAEEALQWFQAREEAARLGIPNLLRFVAPDVVVDGSFRARVAVGRAAYITHVQQASGEAADEHAMTDVYLDTAGALVVRGGSAVELDDVTAFEIDDHGMMTHESDLMSASNSWFTDDSAFAAAGGLADTYLRGWSAADADALRMLYSPGATLVDSMRHLELTGSAAIGRYMQGPTSDASSMVAPADAVFFRFLYGSWERPDELLVFIPYTARPETGCRGKAATLLHVSSGVIVSERRYHEIESVRRCWAAERLPAGWWTGLRPPAPYEDVVTGTVRVAGQRIEIHNGTSALERLVRWAVERFEATELPPPSVTSVTFEEGMRAPECAVDRTGLTVDLGDSAQLYLCLAHEDVCEADPCTILVPSARLLMLHELAHAWMHEHVDGATQQSFMDRMGLEGWSSPDLDWYDRGVEQAAQIIAWGLMDEPIRLSRLDVPCDRMVEAFRLLTGAEPPRDACSELD